VVKRKGCHQTEQKPITILCTDTCTAIITASDLFELVEGSGDLRIGEREPLEFLERELAVPVRV
jgi:hypothetical protein